MERGLICFFRVAPVYNQKVKRIMAVNNIFWKLTLN